MRKKCANCHTEHQQNEPDNAIAYFCSLKCAYAYWDKLKENVKR